MFCLSCQTQVQRKSLDDYFKRTTTCVKCQRLKNTSFEESIVNNWAYLNQIAWVLHPIDIEVNIDV